MNATHVPRVAVVGAGPAGFYAAQALLKRFPTARIDVLERLPVPFGLVRYGVAPDHEATRNVISHFSALMSGHSHRLRFFGNVTVHADGADDGGEAGQTLTWGRLHELYHCVVAATGASQPRAHPLEPALRADGLLGRDVHVADDVMQWLNGHPGLHTGPRAAAGKALGASLGRARSVAVVGAGNVALDVARLLLSPRAQLRSTPVAHSALRALGACDGDAGAGTRHVTLVVRKPAAQAAWTAAALRELVGKTAGVVTRCDVGGVQAGLDDKATGRREKRKLDVLAKHAVDMGNTSVADTGDKRLLSLVFRREVAGFEAVGCGADGETGDADRLDVVLSGTGPDEGVIERLGCDAAVLSLGYVGGEGDGYRVGWANGKASGIIGDNKWDAETVVSAMGEPEVGSGRDGIEAWLDWSNAPVVTWDGWERIDAFERGDGEGPRRPVEDVEQMLSIALSASTSSSSSSSAT